MPKDIFISYSRRDKEFVTRLASDLNAHVTGVWFDQSEIQLGEDWHAEIMDGIRACKAFILVLSPNAVESKYVREELDQALELGKTIFPVIYRPGTWPDEFNALVKEIQSLNLHSGSYMDNFQKLVDGLVEAGAAKASGARPFLRQTTTIPLKIVFGKIPAWAFAWSLGWLFFWVVALVILAILVVISIGKLGSDDLLNFTLILIGAGIGGFTGGLMAGLATMLTLRPNAPSIAWKHMSPTIRIWGISGPLGMIVSGIITVIMLAVGAIGVQSALPDCGALGFRGCVELISGSAQGEFIGILILILLVYALIVIAAWFLTGMFAGWLAVRHIRTLEPGITNRQAWSVSAGWGCGAIVAAIVMIALVGIISSVFRL